MLWLLVRPPEAGGLGMAPSEAERLTLAAAELYLADDKRIKSACRAMNAAAGGKTTEELRAEWREEMARRREHFTGSRELKR